MKNQKNLVALICFLLITKCSANLLEAQDCHYWAQQYGVASTLMGGAMIGGVNDNSAIYYNPGALAFINNPSLSIDANVYKFDKIFIRNGAGQGVNLNSAQISIYPQIITGMINLIKSDKFKLSYTMLTRNHNNIKMNSRYTRETIPGIPEVSGKGFVGAFDYTNQLIEEWFGFGIGYKVNEKLGIGLTLFSSYRGETYQLTNYVREIKYLDPNYNYINRTNDETIKYNTFRSLVKIGFSYITSHWKYGVTITTPSIGHYGKGSIQRENSYLVVSDNADDMADNFMIMDQKSNINASYKHPLSIAGGIDYHSAKTRLAISAEYFFKIKTYHVMDPDATPFVYPPNYLDSANVKTLINNYLQVDNSAKQVLNIGIGLNQTLSKKFSLLLGASTDFSSFNFSGGANELIYGFSKQDIYHFSGGISYHKQKSTFSIGFTYSLSPSQKTTSYADIIENTEMLTDTRLTSHSYAIVFGYTYYFAKFSE